ncbi:zinc finger, C3HC4 type (RING finger) domain-containing protein [Cryptosporidium felis]|nr:zinc finger, C3HC4 type (RING finger) domain-containing protein [Cryptosporidium felis]
MSFYLQNESTGVDEENGISWVVHLEPAEEVERASIQTNFRRLNNSELQLDLILTDSLVTEYRNENPSNTIREYEVITENETNNRIMLAIIVNIFILLGIFGLFTTTLILLIRDWGNQCDRLLKMWCIVWLSRFLLTSIIRSLSAIISKVYQRQSPFALVLVVNILHIFGIGWWFYGINLIYTNPPELTCRRNYSIALFLFWFQFVQIFTPILFPVILCILILYILHRNGVQTEKKNVPEDLLCKIQAIPFTEHIKNLNSSVNVTVFNEDQISTETAGSQNNLSGTPLPFDEKPILIKEKSITINKSCPICVQEIEDEATIRVLPCDPRHIFHIECIDGWFKENCVCPICRSDVVLLLKGTPT